MKKSNEPSRRMMLGAFAILPFAPLLAVAQANDAVLVALGQELDELMAQINLTERNPNSDGYLFERLEILFERLEILEKEIMSAQAATMEGLFVKARVALNRFMMTRP